MVYKATTELSKWNFRDYHVGSDLGGKNQGRFINPETTLFAATPARKADLVGGEAGYSKKMVPMGSTDNISVNQNRMIQPIFEIGSRRGYFLTGHANNTLSVSRPMFSGPSVLRAVTAGTGDHEGLGDDGPAAGYSTDTKQDPAWYGNDNYDQEEATFYINLQAEIFDRPVGFIFYMRDQRKKPFGAVMIEDAMVQMHGFNIASQGLSMPEQISMMFDRIVPVVLQES